MYTCRMHHWAVSCARCIVESFYYYPSICAWIFHMYCFTQVWQLQFFNYLTLGHFALNIYKILWVAYSRMNSVKRTSADSVGSLISTWSEKHVNICVIVRSDEREKREREKVRTFCFCRW
jgi:hypothetical protein